MERIITNSKPFECECGWLVCAVYSNDGKRRMILIDYEETINEEPEMKNLLDNADFIFTYNSYSMVKHYCDYPKKIKFGG